ncbi:MAG: serine/threonine protein kinase [Bacteroidales bacterium]|nr:serine/threonine protein kinase [Bacteroidales bacterium]
MKLQTGHTLQNGKYTIERSIGSGSFGITYLASMRAQVSGSLGELETTIPVAIKEFFMSDLNSRAADGSLVEGAQNTLVANYRRRFRTEAQNLGKMKNHPHIVKVLDVWDENNTTYYSMEHIDGMSLDDYILQQGAIPEQQALPMFAQLADAVQYMHSQRMLHLDIKPKNAMVRKDGRVVLIDFGLSKQYDASGEPESSTRVGGGTPGYAPVEQADFHDGKDFPVTMDIYALGGTLYKMLTGKVPPVASAIVSEGFPSGDLRNRHVSDTTIAVVKKAMSPSRHDRQQSVREFLDALGTHIPQNEATQLDQPPLPAQNEQTEIENLEVATIHTSTNTNTTSKKKPSVEIHPVDKHKKTFVTIEVVSAVTFATSFLIFFLLLFTNVKHYVH